VSRSRPSRSSRDDLKLHPGFLILLFCFVFPPATAQDRISHALLRPSVVDTPSVVLEGDLVDITPPHEKSTALAMLLSAVVPGAGQVYTERWVRIPIIWGFGYYFGSQMSRLNDKYKDYRDRYEASVIADTISGTGDAQLKSIREFYKDQRDEFAVYLGITYVLNIVDAYVGAALYGFDVSPDLHNGFRMTFTVPILPAAPSRASSGSR